MVSHRFDIFKVGHVWGKGQIDEIILMKITIQNVGGKCHIHRIAL